MVFKTDERVDILEPTERSTVSLPLKLKWQVQDFQVARSGGSFLVLIDRSPMAPGDSMDALVRAELACKGAALDACLTADSLAQRGVYRTARTSLTLPRMASRPGVSDQEKDRHEITITLLDASGRRVSEAAWTVTFEVAGAA
jgi:hypothetical protein